MARLAWRMNYPASIRKKGGASGKRFISPKFVDTIFPSTFFDRWQDSLVQARTTAHVDGLNQRYGLGPIHMAQCRISWKLTSVVNEAGTADTRVHATVEDVSVERA